MSVRRIPVSATLDLRQRVLRPDQRVDELARPGDDDPRTAHFGAFEEARLVATAGGAEDQDEPRLVAIATVMPEREPEGPGDWRIRGVATEPAARGRGHGRAVIEACLAHARAHGGSCVWLNGRVLSAAFYRALGFEVVGEAFETPPSGPHHRFRRRA